MLKQLFLMHYIEDHSETLNQQGIQQAKLLANGPLADEIPPHVIILCSPSPQAKKIAEIIAAKFSVPRWVIPVETTDSLGNYGAAPRFELDNQALQDIETAMQQNSVVIVVTDPIRVEGISRALGHDVRLKNAECLVYERQQGLTEKGGPLSLAGRLTVNYQTSKACAALPTRSSPKRIFHFVHGHLTSRVVSNGDLISAASLAALGIIAEVDGRFGLSGLTEIKVVAGQEQLYVHIPQHLVPNSSHSVT
jgi:phosphohistidine phosphatase SixA